MLNNYVLTDLHEKNVISGIKPYYKVSYDVSSYSDDYRQKLNNLYDELDGIKPIDSEIDSVLYMDNYVEKGVSVKPSISGFKQIWLEYRLMYNENEKKKASGNDMYTDIYSASNDDNSGVMAYGMASEVTNNSFVLDNFDAIYDRLAERVVGANKHIDDLREMRENLNNSSDELELEKKTLEQEKREFDAYREEQIKMINDEKQKIEDNSKKLQDLIDGFEEKLNSIL